jgi:hypothetical protein
MATGVGGPGRVPKIASQAGLAPVGNTWSDDVRLVGSIVVGMVGRMAGRNAET